MSLASLAVLTPSRGRPHNARRLAEACQATTRHTNLIIGVDEDDPALADYQRLAVDMLAIGRLEILPAPPRRGLVPSLNELARRYAGLYELVAFLGDDHVPQTPGWDTALCDAVRAQGGGLAYGDDLLQHDKLPTAVVMSSHIPRMLGYLAPPALWHLYVDSAWLCWGQALRQLTYLPQVVIEHRHPGAGTGPQDAGYATTGSSSYDEHDRLAFEDYCRVGLAADVARLRVG